MLLAAGRGERMQSLTDNTPKPLLKVAEKSLIEYHLYALAQAGIEEVVINVCYLAEKIQQALGKGERYGVKIHYSIEQQALGLGGGVYQALPLLGKEPFIVISSDIWTAYPLVQLPSQLSGLAHMMMVDNPNFHPQGDFVLQENEVIDRDGSKLTYGGIGVFQPQFFQVCGPGVYSIMKPLQLALLRQQVRGEHYQGAWWNVTTARELAEVETYISLNPLD
ncbi:MAG: nucleotidyltransferase family protein [Gammaproteobacteria bacterium]|nr:nucleotidyltransferase family protein [Gammaproteobacteria bacterium]